MYHKMHDGPSDDFLIRAGRVYRPTGKPKATIAALQWAADQANQSYGIFTQRLAQEDEARIQAEFEAYKANREAAAEVRRAEHAAMTDDQPRQTKLSGRT